MKREQIPLCWINGTLQAAAEARLSVYDHGLLYGDGIFEGIRYYRGTPFRLEAHLRRLEDSAAALGLSLPVDGPGLTAAIRLLIRESGGGDGYLRLLVTRGEGALGLDPATCPRPNVIIMADALSLVDAELVRTGIRVIVASTRRLEADGLDPRIKSLNYLNQVMARMEASRAGAHEAILLNRMGRVAEGTADNLFIVRDGLLATPPVFDGALDGITRGLILQLARQAGVEARERSLTAYDLYTADECFLTGTGAELIPVASVDGRPLRHSPGPLFQRLGRAFRRLIREECG